MKVDKDRIRELRLDRSWSQEALAERAGVSLRTIQRMETDGVGSLQSRGAVADALEVLASELALESEERLESSEGLQDRRKKPHVSLQPRSFSANALRLRAASVWILIMIVLLSGGYYWTARQGEGIESIDESPEREPLIVTIGYGNVENAISVAGALWPKEIVSVNARASGELVRIDVEIGDYVEEGQLLAQIDPAEQRFRVETSELNLLMLRNQMQQRVLALEAAEDNLARVATQDAPNEQEIQGARSGWLSARTDLENFQLQILQAERQHEHERTQLARTEVRAPIAGTVISLDQKEGAILSALQTAPTVMQIADLNTLTVEAEIRESDIAAVRDSVGVYFTTFGTRDRRWEGELTESNPMPSSGNTISYEALIDVDNSQGELHPGMTTQVFFVTSFAGNVLTVPVGALTFPETPDGGSSATVEVVAPDGTTETREVAVGAMDSVNAEVVGGLEAGERVIAGFRS